MHLSSVLSNNGHGIDINILSRMRSVSKQSGTIDQWDTFSMYIYFCRECFCTIGNVNTIINGRQGMKV